MSGEPYITIRVERKRSLPDYGHETISVTMGQVPEHASQDYRLRMYDKATAIVDEIRAVIESRFMEAARPAPSANPLLAPAIPPGENPLLATAPAPVRGPEKEPLTFSSIVEDLRGSLKTEPEPERIAPVTQEAIDATVTALVQSTPLPVITPEIDPEDIVPPEEDDGPIQFGKGLVTLGHPYSGYEFENHEGHESVQNEAHRLRQLNSALNRCGFTDYRHQLARLMFRRTIDSLNQLSVREAEVMYDFLMHATDDQKREALKEARK